jgi:hypothetical protein
MPILLVEGSAWAQEGQAAFVAWRAPPALFFFFRILVSSVVGEVNEK